MGAGAGRRYGLPSRISGAIVAIPARLIRTVPTDTTAQVESWWELAAGLHPDWDTLTLRDPIDAEQFPLTSPHWADCSSGAQLAGLVRLEALLNWGGIYLDSDVELHRRLESLLQLKGFAAWEDANCVPDAVLGFEAGHPVLEVMIADAIAHLADGAWQSGPGVTTRHLQGRDDVLLLPPGSFYPYHYRIKHRFDPRTPSGQHARDRIPIEQPWAFGAHHWHHSWRNA
jgi:hypothetical protein